MLSTRAAVRCAEVTSLLRPSLIMADPSTNDPAGLWKRRKLYELGWPGLALCLERLREAVVNAGFRPTLVAGISRGGLVPAVHLSNVLDVDRFLVMAIARNLGNDTYCTKQEPTMLWESPGVEVRGESVLLVDDVVGEGRTLAFAVRHLQEHGAGAVRTAVIARMERSSYRADFEAITPDDWIVFPWEPVRAAAGTDGPEVVPWFAGTPA